MDEIFIGDYFKMVAQILVDMDLREALLEAINIKVHRWNYTQTLDYVNFPFRCIRSHTYVHLAKDYFFKFTRGFRIIIFLNVSFLWRLGVGMG
jgi:hypothetical protein